MTRAPLSITSRDNPLLVRLRRLAQGGQYRRVGLLWLEGDHLCRAALQRGWALQDAVLPASAWDDTPALRELAGAAARVVLLPDALFAAISPLDSPGRIGCTVALPPALAPEPGLPSVVLDRLQDAGNVGSILRSAAALGVTQVLALQGTVALWSPKVLRAAMGAHFVLRLVEQAVPGDVAALGLPTVATSSHAGAMLGAAVLPHPCAWLLGHEGQGLAPALSAAATLAVRIPQPGGEESLNVAAAAAICFYEGLRQRLSAEAGVDTGSPGRKSPARPSAR